MYNMNIKLRVGNAFVEIPRSSEIDPDTIDFERIIDVIEQTTGKKVYMLYFNANRDNPYLIDNVKCIFMKEQNEP